jgi:hypothetical protein
VKIGSVGASSSSLFEILVLNNRLYNRLNTLRFDGSGCFGGARWLSLNKLLSSFLDCFFSFFDRYFPSAGPGVIAGLVPPKATKLGLLYVLENEC